MKGFQVTAPSGRYVLLDSEQQVVQLFHLMGVDVPKVALETLLTGVDLVVTVPEPTGGEAVARLNRVEKPPPG